MEHWICTEEFVSLEPVSFFRKELEPYEPRNHPDNLKNLHVLVRKKFSLRKTHSGYKIRITADDYYKLYLNGVFVGQGPAPSYESSYYYNTYDISELLQDGENVIAVHCYYQGLVNRVWTSGDLRQGLYAGLYAEEELLFKTDESWKYTYDHSFDSEGKSIGYDTQFAENIDMRQRVKGWMAPGFDDSGWKQSFIKQADDHVLNGQITPSVDVFEIFSQKAWRLDEKSLLLDFGKEVVGGLKASVNGNRGERLRLLFGEELLESGHVRYEMRCNVCYEEIWTLSGGEEVIENYDYKGFRYVEVQSDTANFDNMRFRVMARHYPVKQKMFFRSSDEDLNKIWDICENAVLIASQEGFLDCPTREKGQYLGDLTVTALSHTYLSGDSRLYQKALTDFANSDFICKGLMAVAPCSFMQEIADFSLLYPLQLEGYYRLSGDDRFVRKFLPVAEAVMDHFKEYERGDGLLESVTDKWNLVDWPENLRDHYDFELSIPVKSGCHCVINAYYYGAMKAINRLRAQLGLSERYDTEGMKAAFFAAFYDEQTKLFRDSEASRHSSLHANALPLFFDMAEGEDAASLVALIAQKGLCCGVFFSYFVLKALARQKRYDLVYQLITSDSEHSWKNMLKEGATACFEAWGKEQKRNTSLCHPWASAPIILIIEELLGIEFEAGKLKNISPHLPDTLSAEVHLHVNGQIIERKF